MKKKQSIFFVLFSLILFLGFYLRVQSSFTETFAFTYDVGRDLLAAREIITTHKIPLIGATTGLPGLFYGPWWYYFLVPSLFLFQGDPKSVLLVIVLSGVVTSVLGYILGKRMGGIYFGFLVGSFIALSPALIGITSQIWNPNLAPFLVMLAMFIFFQHLIKEKTQWYFYLLFGTLCGFLLDVEIIFGILMISSFVISYFLFKKKKSSIPLLYSLGGLILILSPRIIFDLRHQFLMTKSAIAFITHNSQAAKSAPIFEKIIKSASAQFDMWINTVADGNRIFGGIILLFSIILIVIYKNYITENLKKLLLFVIVCIVVFFLGLTFLPEDVWAHYLVGLPAVYIFFLAIPIFLVYSQKKYSIFSYVLLISLFLLNFHFSSLAPWKSSWKGDASVYKNQRQVVDYIYKNAQGKKFKYIVYTPPVHDYSYQYLFSWYGKKQYGYVPSEKSKSMYVILEPDTQYPEREIAWLKERENDGVIQSQKKLPGGLIVQERIIR